MACVKIIFLHQKYKLEKKTVDNKSLNETDW